MRPAEHNEIAVCLQQPRSIIEASLAQALMPCIIKALEMNRTGSFCINVKHEVEVSSTLEKPAPYIYSDAAYFSFESRTSMLFAPPP